VIELVGGLLIAIGLFTGFAAFIASGQMAAAYFMRHARESFWPVLNEGELAALYCFLFLFMAAYGSGIWSVDAARRGGAHVTPAS
jgi:putative oxidoreductase